MWDDALHMLTPYPEESRGDSGEYSHLSGGQRGLRQGYSVALHKQQTASEWSVEDCEWLCGMVGSMDGCLAHPATYLILSNTWEFSSLSLRSNGV